MDTCLFGIEAELAVAATQGGQPLPTETVVRSIQSAAKRSLVHLADGGRLFLQNGGLFYIDYGLHPEWATPECTTPTEAVCALRAGERIVADLAEQVRSEIGADEIHVCRSNVDYASGATWGCHESFLGRRRLSVYEGWLVPHLVSRIAMVGSGGIDPLSPGIRLSLSPRASYLRRVSSSSTTDSAERGIFNTRDEPLCRGYSRVHVIAGDNCCSQRATWLKMGATALVVALADTVESSSPGWVRLADPVSAMQGFARDIGHRAQVVDGNGSNAAMTAVQIQRTILARIRARLGGKRFPHWAADVCAAWERALDLVDSPHVASSHAFDWPVKFSLFRGEIARAGFTEHSVHVWSLALEGLAQRARDRFHAGTRLDTEEIDRLRVNGALSGSDLDQARRTVGAVGRSWDMGLEAFSRLRDLLCAVDVRFGMVGKGIFDTLDRDGLIPDQSVVSQAQIEAARVDPPQKSRARLRGQWVKTLHGQPGYACSWEGIRNDTTCLDLADPFTSQAEFRPQPRVKSQVQSRAATTLRENAYEAYAEGRDDEARSMLEALLASGFEPADIRCHLARVCLVTAGYADADNHAEMAWRGRADADAYVVARALWLKIALAWIDRGGRASARRRIDSAPRLGLLKTMLQTAGCERHWDMDRVLTHLSPIVTPSQHTLLAALVRVMSGEGAHAELEAIEEWRLQPLEALEG